MVFKLPRHLQSQMPYQVGQWLIWTDTQERALKFFYKIELRETSRPREYAAGVFRFTDNKTLTQESCFYARMAVAMRPGLWQNVEDENAEWVQAY